MTSLSADDQTYNLNYRQFVPVVSDWWSDRFFYQEILEMSVLGRSLFVYEVSVFSQPESKLQLNRSELDLFGLYRALVMQLIVWVVQPTTKLVAKPTVWLCNSQNRLRNQLYGLCNPQNWLHI